MDLESLKKLSDVPLYYKDYILGQIKALKKGVAYRDFWYLKMLKEKMPFLKLINDSNLEKIGRAVLEELTQIKTYNGLINILHALYGENVTILVVSLAPGTFDIDIKGEVSDFDHLNTKENDTIVLANGDSLSLKGYGVFNNYSYEDFLSNFILTGVHLNSINVNSKVVYSVLFQDKYALTTAQGDVLMQGEPNG